MPRAGLNPAIVVEQAAQLADEIGLDRLTLAGVAQRVGVALPSLYKHVRGADALHQQLSARALEELTTRATAAVAGRAGRQALHALAAAFRGYAQSRPGRYTATVRAPDPTDPAHVAAAEGAVNVIYAVLDGYGLSGDRAVDAARCLRSALHGFVALDAAGGFGLPRNINRSYEHMIDALDRALTTWP